MLEKKIDGVVKTSELSESEKDLLEKNYQEVLPYIRTADASSRLVLSDPYFFSVLVGLNPEVAFGNHFTIEAIQHLFKDESLRKKFVILKLISHNQLYSFINIPRARAVFSQHNQSLPEHSQVQVDSADEVFVDSLVHAFEVSTPQESELLYGLLSGFPFSASAAFSDSKKETADNTDFKFQTIKILPQGKTTQKPNIWGEKYWDLPMPAFKFSPVKKATSSNGEEQTLDLPPYKPLGLFFGGFRIQEGGELDPELQNMYARYNFIYLTLGGKEELKEIHLKAAEEITDRENGNVTAIRKMLSSLFKGQ
jgi:hypothetical protein